MAEISNKTEKIISEKTIHEKNNNAIGEIIDPVSQQYELLINEIESTDGHLATALKSVYEGSDHNKFFHHLGARINSHDKEIERMCNHHYQGFIESVHSLLQVRSDVEKLKFEIQLVNRELQNSGKSLLKKGEELAKYRKTQQHIELAIETLSNCLPVLETYGKLKKQMASKRYYPALKTLEQLEHTYLPRVSKYRFSEPMQENVSRIRDSIKESSMSELKDFLESIRKHSGRIGEVAMKQMAEEKLLEPQFISLGSKKQQTDDHLKRIAPQPPNNVNSSFTMCNGAFDDFDSEEGLCAQDLIDFAPVYRCLHIYSVLGDKETFETYYRNQRKKQVRLALQPSVSMDSSKITSPLANNVQLHQPHTTLDSYKNYFNGIIGYFVIEDHIMNTTTGLINQVYLDDLWEKSLSKIIAHLTTHIGFCTDTQLLLQVKKLLRIFCFTLRSYGFTTSQLFELLFQVRDQYSEILRKQWVEIFNKIFEEDNYTPITVYTKEEYQMITQAYPYNDEELERHVFPKQLPFSQFVPAVFLEVKKYISACLDFSEDLHISKLEKGEWILNGSIEIIDKILIVEILRLIHRPNLTLVKLIQISINMEHLDQSCIYLEDFISQLSGANQDNARVSKLHGQSMFKTAKSEAESEIYKQINLKIDEFFDLALYDWMLMEPVEQPSGYILDMLSFLKGIFKSFTNLPEKVAETACMSACKHIGELMMNMIKDDQVKCMSDCVLQQFDRDLRECEKFTDENPIGGLDGKTYGLAFADLRQLLNLFISEEWSLFFSDYGKKQNKYLRVQPIVCIKLLEKLKEGDKKKSNIFNTFKKNERDKKKLIETILKQLKLLVNEQHY